MNRVCYLSTAYWAPVQYFTKLILFDTAFIEQFETYPKQSYRNRLVIYGANGLQALQIPVLKGSFKNILLKDIEISYTENWQKNHFKSIESAYRSAPFYEYYIDDVAPFFTKKHKFLIDLNQEILLACMEMLGITTALKVTESFELNLPDDDFRYAIHPKVDKLVLDPAFKPKEYIQGFEQRHGFMANLSILDLIFNTGPEANKIIKESII